MTTHSSFDPANRPLRLGCVGLAGYAKMMSGIVLEHGGSTSPPVELVAAAGPEAAADHEHVAELEGHGVRVFAELDAMLSEAKLDAAWVLAPIHLHEPLTRRCLDAGRPETESPRPLGKGKFSGGSQTSVRFRACLLSDRAVHLAVLSSCQLV